MERVQPLVASGQPAAGDALPGVHTVAEAASRVALLARASVAQRARRDLNPLAEQDDAVLA